MPCKRCQIVNDIPIDEVQSYVYLPTAHHQSPFEGFLNHKNISYEYHNDFYLVETKNFKMFIEELDELFNPLEKKDIKILPYNPSDGLVFHQIHELRTLNVWINYFQGEPLRKMIKEKRIKVLFQSIHDAKTQDVIGYEGLIRGIDETGEIISPKQMFNDAKSLDLLFNLDKLARETIIKRFSEGDYKGLLFINFIPTSIYDPAKCLQTTDNAIEKYGLKPQEIVFEVVETEKIYDFTHLNTILEHYRNKGYNTALDDVGSGYSNAEVLINLTPNIIKIDASIIRNIHQSTSQQKELQKYIDLAKKHHIKVLTEGVETKEELDYLKTKPIDYIQGYYFSKPV